MRNLPHGLDIYLVNVQTMGKTAKKFVAHSEKLNFTKKKLSLYIHWDLSLGHKELGI